MAIYKGNGSVIWSACTLRVGTASGMAETYEIESDQATATYKTLIVETGESGKEVDAKNVHDEVIVVAENRNSEASSFSSKNKVDVADE